MNEPRFRSLRTLLQSAFGILLLLTGCTNGVMNSGGGGNGGGAQASVTVSGSSQVRLGGTASFSATVTNLTNTAVTWQVAGINGGNSSVGTIISSGVYTPPSSIPATNPVTVTAVSVASPSASGSASLNVLNPVPTITSASATRYNITERFSRQSKPGQCIVKFSQRDRRAGLGYGSGAFA